jgi:hypothetical protein
MTSVKVTAVIAFLAACIAPSFSPTASAADLHLERQHHRHYVRVERNPYLFKFSYNHNYGPVEFVTDGVRAIPDRIIHPIGERPYAYYDVNQRYCGQSTASYRGQDGQRHPCN